MNDRFVANTMTAGEKGKKWLQQIPEIIQKYEDRWKLHVLPPFDLSYNYVAPVVQEDGKRAVIRIGIPWEKDEFFNEVKSLKLFHGRGVPSLLKEAEDEPVILIEMIEPGQPLSTLDDETKTLNILAALMKKIWKKPPDNITFITIHQWIRALRNYHQSDPNGIPQALAQEGMTLFDELLTSTKGVVVTHADLHHDNVLLSDKEGWVAIDPKGIVADPLYDTSALIRNPYDKLKNLHGEALDDLLQKRIIILAQELGQDPKRIHKWCLAQTILSGVWTVDNQEYTDFDLKIASALQRIRV